MGQPRFITSAAVKKGFLQTDKPVIAVSGRSNVGKSSFINMLAGQKRLARTSSEPGRTRLVNYFDFGTFILADLPGYGYARVSQGEKEKWARLLDDFFGTGEVAHVFALVDIRHAPSADDALMVDYLYKTRTPFTLIATKADKLAKTRRVPAARALAAALKTGEGNIVVTSAEENLGRERVLALAAEICARATEEAEEEEEEE